MSTAISNLTVMSQTNGSEVSAAEVGGAMRYSEVRAALHSAAIK